MDLQASRTLFVCKFGYPGQLVNVMPRQREYEPEAKTSFPQARQALPHSLKRQAGIPEPVVRLGHSINTDRNQVDQATEHAEPSSIQQNAIGSHGCAQAKLFCLMQQLGQSGIEQRFSARYANHVIALTSGIPDGAE